MSNQPYPATVNQLMRDTRGRLAQYCRDAGLPDTGRKIDLADRYASYLRRGRHSEQSSD